MARLPQSEVGRASPRDPYFYENRQRAPGGGHDEDNEDLEQPPFPHHMRGHHFDRDRGDPFFDRRFPNAQDFFRNQRGFPDGFSQGFPMPGRRPFGVPEFDDDFDMGFRHSPRHYEQPPQPQNYPYRQYNREAPDKAQHRQQSPQPPPRQGSSSRYNFQGDSIPIRVIHERNGKDVENNNQRPPENRKHAVSSRNTTELPAKKTANQAESSPRLERAHSEPPKNFEQRAFSAKPNYDTIQESSAGRRNDAPSGKAAGLKVPLNLSTSASSPSVPSSSPVQSRRPTGQQRPQEPQQKYPYPTPDPDDIRKHSAPPAVRHIPIRVEGREPPTRNATARGGQVEDEAAPFPKPSDYYPQGVQRKRPQELEKVKKDQKGMTPAEPTSPVSPPPGPIPMGCSESHLNIPSAVSEEDKASTKEPTSPMPAPKEPIPLPCGPQFLGQTDESTSSESQKSGQQIPVTVEVDGGAKEKKEPNKHQMPETIGQPHEELSRKPSAEDVALQKMEKVRAEVESLIKRINNFKGSKKDKEYLYLDEMLTRHLLSLDSVDTGGRDDLRQLRKDAIRSINRCLSMLDSKASSMDADDNNKVLDHLVQESQSKGKESQSDQDPEKSHKDSTSEQPIQSQEQKKEDGK